MTWLELYKYPYRENKKQWGKKKKSTKVFSHLVKKHKENQWQKTEDRWVHIHNKVHAFTVTLTTKGSGRFSSI